MKARHPIDTFAERRAIYSRKRRDRLRDKKLCINGPKHGEATDGCRCRKCFLVHRYGPEAATAIFDKERQEHADESPTETIGGDSRGDGAGDSTEP